MGDNFKVRRALPAPQRRMVGPFVFLDQMKLQVFAAGRGLGGKPMDGPRYLTWNFVSSSAGRIEQAKEDWKNQNFPKVPGETEFIPLPDLPRKPVYYQ
jgi:redox-sensitive bicupin YhaK (pirin superfamily)